MAEECNPKMEQLAVGQPAKFYYAKSSEVPGFLLSNYIPCRVLAFDVEDAERQRVQVEYGPNRLTGRMTRHWLPAAHVGA